MCAIDYNNLTGRVREALFNAPASPNNPMSETKLAKRFGVSRSPVRDALKELEKEGFIERRKRKGVCLKAPTIDEILAIYDVRAVLEGFAARLASQNSTAKDLKNLIALARKYKQMRKKGKWAKAKAADAVFHSKIVKLSGNPLLIKIMENFDILHRTFDIEYPNQSFEEQKASPYPHERIIEAIKKGNAEKCEKTLRLHIQWSKQGIAEQALGTRLDLFGKVKKHPAK